MERLKYYLTSCPDKCHGYIEDIDELLDEIESLKEQNKKLMGCSRHPADAEEIKRLRRALDNIKVLGYDLGQKQFHDIALTALKEKNDE